MKWNYHSRTNQNTETLCSSTANQTHFDSHGAFHSISHAGWVCCAGDKTIEKVVLLIWHWKKIRLHQNWKIRNYHCNLTNHYLDKPNTLMVDQQKNGISSKLAQGLMKNQNKRVISLNPLNIIKKNDSIKTVLDARHFYSNTDQSSEPWPLERLATPAARWKKYVYLQFILRMHMHMQH